MKLEKAIEQLEFDRAMILFDPTTGEEIMPEILKALNEDNYRTYIADGVAIEALKEVQRYREIGTVEEFRKTADRNNQKQPVWKNGRSTIFKDYVDGHGEAEENKWADWVCPECGWFVGEQYLPRQHNQSKCNFCPKCGQAIRWEN